MREYMRFYIKILGLLSVCLLLISFTGCNRSERFQDKLENTEVKAERIGNNPSNAETGAVESMDNEGNSLTDDSEDEVKDSNSKEDKTEKDEKEYQSSENEKSPEAETGEEMPEIQYFAPEDIDINGTPVLGITYAELTEHFGYPSEQTIYEVQLPASETVEYLNVCVYDGFTCEFYPREEKAAPELTDTVFRFDITAGTVTLGCGLKVGMTVNEVMKLFGKRTVYSFDTEEDGDFNGIKNVLTGYKPEDYYEGVYNEAMLIYHDEIAFGDPFAKALVLLIEDGKVVRIVFGYPTAG